MSLIKNINVGYLSTLPKEIRIKVFHFLNSTKLDLIMFLIRNIKKFELSKVDNLLCSYHINACINLVPVSYQDVECIRMWDQPELNPKLIDEYIPNEFIRDLIEIIIYHWSLEKIQIFQIELFNENLNMYKCDYNIFTNGKICKVINIKKLPKEI